jgi:hypothetical protein
VTSQGAASVFAMHRASRTTGEIAESDAVADAGSASDEPGHICQFCRP